MKSVLGLVMCVAGSVLAVWLALYVMLYGGIMCAVDNWGVDNGAVVWGIIRACFSEFGVIPGMIVAAIGITLIDE